MTAHKNILLMEDNRGDQELIKEALRTATPASKLQIVENGKDGIEYLSNRLTNKEPLPDLILLDLSLPKMDGFEVLSSIKKNTALRIIPVVVLTSSDLPKEIEECYQIGANCCMQKQVGTQEYFEMVRAINTFWFVYAQLPHQE